MIEKQSNKRYKIKYFFSYIVLLFMEILTTDIVLSELTQRRGFPKVDLQLIFFKAQLVKKIKKNK